MHSGEPYQMLPKSRMQNVSEYKLPYFHLPFFENAKDLSDKHTERFHKNIASMENRYKKYNPAMLADFCRNLKHAIIEIFHKSRKYEKLMSITDTLSLTLTAKYRKKQEVQK